MDLNDGTAHSSDPRDFAAVTAGRVPREMDRTLVELNADGYREPSALIGPWRAVPNEELRAAGLAPELLNDQASGFQARLYRDEEGRHVLVFRGTDEGRDWLSNTKQGLGLRDAQYERAVEAARQAAVAFGGSLVLSGHSLGGGLAAAAALATDVPAVTFNAAGVHDRTLTRLGRDPDAARAHAAETGLIRRYTVDNEILTRLQEHTLPLRYALPDAIGHRIRLPDPDPPSWLERLSPLHSLRHGVDVHSMDAVIRALDLQQQRTAPVPAPASHRALGLLDETLRGMDGLPHDRLAIRDGHDYLNAAAFVAARARDEGLGHVDHLVASSDGHRLFAVEGRLDDPGHRRVAIDLAQATTVPMERSAATLAATPALDEPAIRIADHTRLRPLAI